MCGGKNFKNPLGDAARITGTEISETVSVPVTKVNNKMKSTDISAPSYGGQVLQPRLRLYLR